MTIPVLRNFLYIDSRAIDEFLATIEGALFEETITESEKSQTAGTVGAGIAVLKGELETGKESEKEVVRKATLTYPAKFQRLYAGLQKEGAVSYYQRVGETERQTIVRNVVLEAAVTLQTSKLQSTLAVADQLVPLIDLVSSVTGQFNDEGSQQAIAGFSALGAASRQKGIPFVLNFIEECRFRLVGTMASENLLQPLDRIQGEITAFVKVQRLLGESEKFPLTNIVPDLKKIAANREQRRQASTKKLPPHLNEMVKGPAAVVIPIAFYV